MTTPDPQGHPLPELGVYAGLVPLEKPMRQAIPLLVCAPALVAQAPRQPSLTGTWHAALEAGAVKLRVVLHFSPDPSGGWTGTLDSPDQHAMRLPLTEITLTGPALTFQLPAAGARFEGTFEGGNPRIVGTWIQGTRLPITFHQGEPLPPKRPQTPTPPFPYLEERMTCPGGAPGVTLAGTLTRPQGQGPFPALVLLHGSGAHDRDQTLFDHKPFWVLADHLSRKGILVLRYDKRGVGASSGSHATATLQDYASDAEAALTYLKGRSDVDARRVGLLGHSEGGAVAAMVAARHPLPAFAILLAAPAVTGEALLHAQGEALLKANGAPQGMVKTQQKTQARLFTYLKTHPEATAEAVADLLASELPPEARRGAMAALLQQAQPCVSPWFRSFLALDAHAVLRQVKVPVLALYGERDLQVPALQNRPELEKAMVGNRRVKVHTFPGLNHLFQPATTGTPAEYGAIETTLSPDVLACISNWLKDLIIP